MSSSDLLSAAEVAYRGAALIGDLAGAVLHAPWLVALIVGLALAELWPWRGR